jgi:hypothetical protein
MTACLSSSVSPGHALSVAACHSCDSQLVTLRQLVFPLVFHLDMLHLLQLVTTATVCLSFSVSPGNDSLWLLVFPRSPGNDLL